MHKYLTTYHEYNEGINWVSREKTSKSWNSSGQPRAWKMTKNLPAREEHSRGHGLGFGIPKSKQSPGFRCKEKPTVSAEAGAAVRGQRMNRACWFYEGILVFSKEEWEVTRRGVIWLMTHYVLERWFCLLSEEETIDGVCWGTGVHLKTKTSQLIFTSFLKMTHHLHDLLSHASSIHMVHVAVRKLTSVRRWAMFLSLSTLPPSLLVKNLN